LFYPYCNRTRQLHEKAKAKAVLYLFVVVLISSILKTVVGISDVVLPALFLTIAGPILWRDGKVYSSKLN